MVIVLGISRSIFMCNKYYLFFAHHIRTHSMTRNRKSDQGELSHFYHLDVHGLLVSFIVGLLPSMSTGI